jgi:hypothetical protein
VLTIVRALAGLSEFMRFHISAPFIAYVAVYTASFALFEFFFPVWLIVAPSKKFLWVEKFRSSSLPTVP